MSEKEEEARLLEEIDVITNDVSRLKYTLKLRHNKDVLADSSKSNTRKKSIDNLEDVELKFEKDLFRFSGMHCILFTDRYVFEFSAAQRVTEDDVYCVEILNENGEGKLGKWILPESIDPRSIVKHYPLDHFKRVKSFLKSCKYHVDGYTRRKEQYIELQAILSNFLNCSIQNSNGYTQTQIHLLGVKEIDSQEKHNIVVYLLYKSDEARPCQMAVDSINEQELSADQEKTFSRYFKPFMKLDLKDAFVKIIENKKAPFEWKGKSTDDVLPININDVNEDEVDEVNDNLENSAINNRSIDLSDVSPRAEAGPNQSRSRNERNEIRADVRRPPKSKRKAKSAAKKNIEISQKETETNPGKRVERKGKEAQKTIGKYFNEANSRASKRAHATAKSAGLNAEVTKKVVDERESPENTSKSNANGNRKNDDVDKVYEIVRVSRESDEESREIIEGNGNQESREENTEENAQEDGEMNEANEDKNEEEDKEENHEENEEEDKVENEEDKNEEENKEENEEEDKEENEEEKEDNTSSENEEETEDNVEENTTKPAKFYLRDLRRVRGFQKPKPIDEEKKPTKEPSRKNKTATKIANSPKPTKETPLQPMSKSKKSKNHDSNSVASIPRNPSQSTAKNPKPPGAHASSSRSSADKTRAKQGATITLRDSSIRRFCIPVRTKGKPPPASCERAPVMRVDEPKDTGDVGPLRAKQSRKSIRWEDQGNEGGRGEDERKKNRSKKTLLSSTPLSERLSKGNDSCEFSVILPASRSKRSAVDRPVDAEEERSKREKDNVELERKTEGGASASVRSSGDDSNDEIVDNAVDGIDDEKKRKELLRDLAIASQSTKPDAVNPVVKKKKTQTQEKKRSKKK